MKYKMLVFDLDGTLCPLGKGILPEDIARLKTLEKRGYTIVVCSGKPTYYLCGLLRQIGLEHPVMIGENGATFQFGVDLPPKRYHEYPYSALAKEQLRFFREKIEKACGSGVWWQPNEVELTPFIGEPSCFDTIQRILDENPDRLTELSVYRHADCFDLIPKNIDKLNGIKYLGELTGVSTQEMISFGDGVNDVPMFKGTGLSVAIGGKLDFPTDLKFATIGEALDYVLSL